MREKLRSVPWWVWSVIAGVLFGTFTAVFRGMDHPGSWTGDIVFGLSSGVFFGAVLGPHFAGQGRTESAAVNKLPARGLRVASRAVMRGSVPLDPDIRRAAAQLASDLLKSLSRFRWLTLLIFASVTLPSAFYAFTSSPRGWIAVAIFALFGVLYLMMLVHLKRRAKILRHVTYE